MFNNLREKGRDKSKKRIAKILFIKLRDSFVPIFFFEEREFIFLKLLSEYFSTHIILYIAIK